MNLIRCPACDGVLNSTPQHPLGELCCSTCRRHWTAEYLEALNQPRGPRTVQEENTVFSVPDISSRINTVVRAIEPLYHRKLRNTLLWAFGIFMTLGLICSGIIEAELGYGIWMFFCSLFLSVALAGFTAMFFGIGGPGADITAAEALEQIRQENRRANEEEQQETSSDLSPQPRGESTENTDTIKRTSP